MRLPNGYGSVIKMSGKRRKPYAARKTAGWHYDKEKDKQVQDFVIIGYAETKAEALQILSNYNNNPYDLTASKMTFEEVYNEWSSKKYPTISESNVHSYKASYNACTVLWHKTFKDIKLNDLQMVIDTCGKNYPTLRKIKVLFNQLYDYALKYEIVGKDYSEYVDIIQYKDKNPNKYDRNKFDKDEIRRVWSMKDDKYYQIVLMLLYNGTRVSEFLDLKKEHVHLEEQYFEVVSSKTENGIRKVPIPDLLLPYYTEWYYSAPNCEYLLHTEEGLHFQYRNYYDSYYTPIMQQIGIDRTPHCCRHTCISLLSEAGIQDTTIKKIVGHSGAMTLTERVYTHLDVQILIDAVNKICIPPEQKEAIKKTPSTN